MNTLYVVKVKMSCSLDSHVVPSIMLTIGPGDEHDNSHFHIFIQAPKIIGQLLHLLTISTMNRENQPLVTDETFEFEK